MGTNVKLLNKIKNNNSKMGETLVAVYIYIYIVYCLYVKNKIKSYKNKGKFMSNFSSIILPFCIFI